MHLLDFRKSFGAVQLNRILKIACCTYLESTFHYALKTLTLRLAITMYM